MTISHWIVTGAAGWMLCGTAFDAFGAADAAALLAQNRCYVCHADREVVTGPAFADVAAQLKPRKDGVVYLAREIRGGLSRGGPWHMPPHPEISQAEANVMARYIMNLADSPPAAPAPGTR